MIQPIHAVALFRLSVPPVSDSLVNRENCELKLTLAEVASHAYDIPGWHNRSCGGEAE